MSANPQDNAEGVETFLLRRDLGQLQGRVTALETALGFPRLVQTYECSVCSGEVPDLTLGVQPPAFCKLCDTRSMDPVGRKIWPPQARPEVS